jgi:hypothetical protein
MPSYTSAMGGQTILATLRAKLAESKSAITKVTTDDALPVEYRRRVRNEAVTTVLGEIREASVAFSEWAKSHDADARRRYAADPVGNAADETRRMTNEFRLGRLVTTARANGTPKIIAERYAEDAMTAYLSGRYDDAITFGQASLEVGGGGISQSRASSAIKAAQDQLDLANPERALALSDIAEAEKGVRVFSRDINGALADLYTAAADAAQAIGDDDRLYRKNSVGPSMLSKAIEVEDAAVAGRAYTAPVGALASSPTGTPARSIPDGFGPTPVPVTERYGAGNVTRVTS